MIERNEIYIYRRAHCDEGRQISTDRGDNSLKMGISIIAEIEHAVPVLQYSIGYGTLLVYR